MKHLSSKNSLTWSPSIMVIVGIMLSSAAIFLLAHDGKPVATIQGVASPTEASVGIPIHLKIPKINVDSAVTRVGLTPNGAMDIPKKPEDVAWFELGQRPGEKGSAVIAGHYSWEHGTAAAFDNLYKLRKGDKVYVEDDKGALISFVVSGNRRYDPNEDASGVFGSNDGTSHLNLITCEGAWNSTEKTYSDRLVVFTDREME